MPNVIRRLFTEHPNSVDESYTEHAGFALSFAFRLFQAAAAALVHAVIPGLCEKTASTIVQELAAKTKNRGRETTPTPTGPATSLK